MFIGKPSSIKAVMATEECEAIQSSIETLCELTCAMENNSLDIAVCGKEKVDIETIYEAVATLSKLKEIDKIVGKKGDK